MEMPPDSGQLPNIHLAIPLDPADVLLKALPWTVLSTGETLTTRTPFVPSLPRALRFLVEYIGFSHNKAFSFNPPARSPCLTKQ